MNNWFGFKPQNSKEEKTVGFHLRVCGIDLAVQLFGEMSDWTLLEIRVPAHYGAYGAVWFAAVFIGRLKEVVV